MSGGANITYDEQGQAWEVGGEDAFPGDKGKRRKDLDIPKIAPPPPTPDLTDEVVLKARSQMVRRMLSSQGIGSTFLTGGMGLPGPAPTSQPGLSGA